MSLSASRNLCDELTAAVHSRNVDRLTELVRQGADLNITLSEGLLPLVLAANNCDRDTCEVLLRLGAKLDGSIGPASRETPLTISVRAGLEDAVATLIELGSDVNVTVDLCTERLSADAFQLYPGSTVLQSAIFRHNMPIIRLLLDAGADVNRADCSGNTALHLACLDVDERAADTVALLLSLNRGSRAACRRTDIDASNCHGQTPLMLAAGRSAELVRLLLKERPAPIIDAKDRRHKTALHYAAEAGLEDATLMLLRAGCHVDGSRGSVTHCTTPLHVAAHSGKVHICRVLLDFGANSVMRTIDGNSVLHQAASSLRGWHGSTDILQRFIDVGVELDGKNSAGYTALAVAASCGNFTISRFLIDAGAQLNEPGSNGMTALSLSITGSHCGLAEMLIVEGANPNSGSVRLPKPVYWTVFRNRIDLFRLLLLSNESAARHHSSYYLQMIGGNSQALVSTQATDPLLREINAVLSNPRELRDLCRLTIRSQLAFGARGSGILRLVSRLPLPRSLIRYLSYGTEVKNNLDDVEIALSLQEL